MANRGNAVPMEFEYDNKNGPVDMRSPFLNHQQRPQQQPFAQQGSFASPSRSPVRSIFKTNPPSGSQTPQAPPFRNPSFPSAFTTPQNPRFEDMHSEASGAESSPADNADAEDTPEMPKLKNMNLFGGNKQPVFGKFGRNYTGASPGRAELNRAKYTTAIVKQRKRKRVERDFGPARRGSNSSEDSGDNGRPANHKGHEPPKGWFARLIDGIVERPTLPYVLSYYPQLILNYVLVFGLIYTLWIFFRAIRADVDAASELAYSAILAEMSDCSQHFIDNQCASGNRLPAIRKLCDSWDICMNRDPSQVGRARVSAHTFATIFNSFIEPISWKAMVFSSMFLVVCITVNNVAFGLYRSKANNPPPNPYQQHDYQWGPVPHPTPQPRHQQEPQYVKRDDNPFPSIMPSATPGRGRSRSPEKKRW